MRVFIISWLWFICYSTGEVVALFCIERFCVQPTEKQFSEVGVVLYLKLFCTVVAR